MHITYLLGVLMYFPVWLILYIHRKDLRKEMTLMGIVIALGAIYTEAFVWTKDWWHPQTITGTVVGIEDVIFAFLIGGIIVSIYEELFKEKLVRFRAKNDHHLKHFLTVVLLSIFIGNFAFFYLHLHSYYATLLAMLVPTIVIYFYREDLILLSLSTGAIVTLLSIPIYIISFFFYPTALNSWFIQKLSGVMLLGIPIEDLVWFFTTGMFIAPLYEFWKGDKLKRIK